MLQRPFCDPRLLAPDPGLIQSLLSDLERHACTPSHGGIIVLDFDGRRRWGAQSVRDLNLLSTNFDYSWIRLDALYGNGWLGEGLYKSDVTLATKFDGRPPLRGTEEAASVRSLWSFGTALPLRAGTGLQARMGKSSRDYALNYSVCDRNGR